MRSILLSLLLCSTAPSLLAQQLEIGTRYDYYFADDEAAVLLLYGDDRDRVESLTVNGTPAEETVRRDDVLFFRIDIRPYDVGRSSLPCRIRLKDGTDRELVLSLNKLEPKANGVRVDRLTGGLMVDELPFFPFGFYAGYPVGDLPVQEIYNMMNLIGVYQSNEQETLAGRKAYMDLCASVGMKVNYSLNGLVGTPHNRTDAVISKEEEERRWALLRTEVETFKDHPALLSWYMNDEPVGQSRSPALLEKAYRMIKEIDPYHPVSVVFVIPERAAPFADALDIAMTDPYPIPGDVDEVRQHMKSLVKHFRFKKALWIVPQAFGGGEFWSREPTGPEIRAMTWLGIIEGAMGVKYFIRRHPNLFPKSRLAWNEAVKVAHEVSMIVPWLFSVEPRRTLSTGSERVRAVALPHKESALVLVANADNRPVQFDIDISSIVSSDSTTLGVPFENRSIMIVDGQLSETIGPLGARAYFFEANDDEPATASRSNLFPNPSFEWVTSPGVPAGAYVDSDTRPAYDGSTYFVDSRVSHKGWNALRMHAVDDTSHLGLTFYRMYVDAGSSYGVSLWSRHSSSKKPVRFNLSVQPLDLRKEFSTSAQWQRHDFYFTANAESPYVQLKVETAGAGTFWIDDVTVAPDPLIGVVVTDGPMAEVTVSSTERDASFAYQLNGGPEQVYSAPFTVGTYTDVDLVVRSSRQIDEMISFTIPLSLATLRDVRFVTPYSEKYRAAGDGTVLDGQYGSLAFRDNKYLGFDGKDVEFVIDLEQSQMVGAATTHFLVSPDDGIHAPRAVEVWTSLDEQRWTPLGKAADLEATRHGGPHHVSVAASGTTIEARFVRVRVQSPKVIPAGYLFSGTDAWIFIDEVLVNGKAD